MNCVKPRWEATKYLKRHQKRNISIKYLKDVWFRSDKKKANDLKVFLVGLFTSFFTCSSSESRGITDFLDVACQMSRSIKPITVYKLKMEVKKSNSKKFPDMTI